MINLGVILSINNSYSVI